MRYRLRTRPIVVDISVLQGSAGPPDMEDMLGSKHGEILACDAPLMRVAKHGHPGTESDENESIVTFSSEVPVFNGEKCGVLELIIFLRQPHSKIAMFIIYGR